MVGALFSEQYSNAARFACRNLTAKAHRPPSFTSLCILGVLAVQINLADGAIAVEQLHKSGKEVLDEHHSASRSRSGHRCHCWAPLSGW